MFNNVCPIIKKVKAFETCQKMPRIYIISSRLIFLYSKNILICIIFITLKYDSVKSKNIVVIYHDTAWLRTDIRMQFNLVNFPQIPHSIV